MGFFYRKWPLKIRHLMGLCHPAVSWLLRISTKWGGLRSCDFDGSDFLKSQHTTQSAVCNHCKAVFWEFLPDEGIRALVISTHQKFSKVSSLYLLCSLISTHQKFLRIRNSQKSAPFLYCVHSIYRVQSLTVHVCQKDFWEFLQNEGIRTIMISTDQTFSKVSPRLNLPCAITI